MTDLTKLTADEIRVRFDVLRPKMNVPARLVLAEISRRLELLEQCEQALLKARMLLISEGDHNEDAEMIAEIDTLIGDAARSALEGE